MRTARLLASLAVLGALLGGCAMMAGPSAECAFWEEPPYTDADVEVISEPFARWLDRTTSAADRICKRK